MITIIDFGHRRKSSTYKLGDYVYFLEPDFSGSRSRYVVNIGQVIELPDKYYASYGIRSLDTPDDHFAMATCFASDMRRLKKAEVRELCA